jgi:hypothetical protein
MWEGKPEGRKKGRESFRMTMTSNKTMANPENDSRPLFRHPFSVTCCESKQGDKVCKSEKIKSQKCVTKDLVKNVEDLGLLEQRSKGLCEI